MTTCFSWTEAFPGTVPDKLGPAGHSTVALPGFHSSQTLPGPEWMAQGYSLHLYRLPGPDTQNKRWRFFSSTSISQSASISEHLHPKTVFGSGVPRGGGRGWWKEPCVLRRRGIFTLYPFCLELAPRGANKKQANF